MANLAQIAGLYTFLLVGWSSAAASTVAVTTVGVVWIVADDGDRRDRDRALRPHPGRPARRRDRHPRRCSPIVALVKVYAGDAPPARSTRSLSWLNPFSLSPSEISAGMLLAVFIYWGWDTTATVNEETEDPSEAPGKATVISTLILLGDLRDRRRRRPGLRRRPHPGRTTRKTCSARSAPRSSARRSTRS